MNSAFRVHWLASSEVISQVLFTSEQPNKNKMAFVGILSQIKLLFGPLVTCVVYTKTIIHLSESGGYLPPLRWIHVIVQYSRTCLWELTEPYNTGVKCVCTVLKFAISQSASLRLEIWPFFGCASEFIFNLVPRAFSLAWGRLSQGKSPGNEIALALGTSINQLFYSNHPSVRSDYILKWSRNSQNPPDDQLLTSPYNANTPPGRQVTRI